MLFKNPILNGFCLDLKFCFLKPVSMSLALHFKQWLWVTLPTIYKCSLCKTTLYKYGIFDEVNPQIYWPRKIAYRPSTNCMDCTNFKKCIRCTIFEMTKFQFEYLAFWLELKCWPYVKWPKYCSKTFSNKSKTLHKPISTYVYFPLGH